MKSAKSGSWFYCYDIVTSIPSISRRDVVTSVISCRNQSRLSLKVGHIGGSGGKPPKQLNGWDGGKKEGGGLARRSLCGNPAHEGHPLLYTTRG